MIAITQAPPTNVQRLSRWVKRSQPVVVLVGSVILNVQAESQCKLYATQLINLSSKHERDDANLVPTILTWNSPEGGEEFQSRLTIGWLTHSQNLPQGANMK